MPVFLDRPSLLFTINALVQRVALNSNGAMDNAAIALLYYTNASTQGAGGNWLCIDDWNPKAQEGDLLGATGWSMQAHDKRFIMVSLGPKGANPKKYIKGGVRYGTPTPQIYLVGYLTYDEVVVSESVISEDRNDYLFPGDHTLSGGWGSGSSSWLEQDVANIPTINIQASDTVSGVLVDFSAGLDMTIEPRAMEEVDLVRYSGSFAMGNMSGCDPDGKVWVSSGASDKAILGYLKVPAVWQTRPKYIHSWVKDQKYNLPFGEGDQTAIIRLGWGTQDYGIYTGGTLYVWPPHAKASNYGVAATHDLLVNIQSDHLGISMEKGPSPIATETSLRGVLTAYYAETSDTVDDDSDLEVSSPSLYYPPDNIGSLYFDYKITGESYEYQDINNLGFNLSGGSGNTDQNLSLGGVKSSTILTSALNSLFDDSSDLDVYAGLTSYRCLYITNSSPTDTAIGINIWTDKEGLDLSPLAVGGDPSGVGGLALNTQDESVMPEGVSFVLATSNNVCYTIPSLAPLEHIAIWFRRVYDLRTEETMLPESVTLYMSVNNNIPR